MAHYAYLDENNIVVEVVVGKDETELINNLDTETYYAQGTNYTVKRTSWNGNYRKNFAGIGYTYNEEKDAFIAPEPETHLGFDEDTCTWIIPMRETNDETLAE